MVMHVFSGIVVDRNITYPICEIIEPSIPSNLNMYYCDKKFHTDYLESMEEDAVEHGIVIVTGEKCSIYSLKNDVTILKWSYKIDKQQGHRKGGQSAQRFNRIHMNQEKEYTKLISEKIVSYKDLFNHIFICGFGDLKDKVFDDINFTNKSKVTISNDNIAECYQKILPLLPQIGSMNDHTIIDRINEIISTNPSLLSFGVKETMAELGNGALSELIVTKNEYEKHKYIFQDYTGKAKISIISTIDDKTVMLEMYGQMMGVKYM